MYRFFACIRRKLNDSIDSGITSQRPWLKQHFHWDNLHEEESVFIANTYLDVMWRNPRHNANPSCMQAEIQRAKADSSIERLRSGGSSDAQCRSPRTLSKSPSRGHDRSPDDVCSSTGAAESSHSEEEQAKHGFSFGTDRTGGAMAGGVADGSRRLIDELLAQNLDRNPPRKNVCLVLGS
jgi:hypothetical protein